jgi:hypothetical protein
MARPQTATSLFMVPSSRVNCAASIPEPRANKDTFVNPGNAAFQILRN